MKTENKSTLPTYSVSLPWFPGFYNSSLDYLIDCEMEQEIEGCPEGGREPCTWEDADARANYPAARLAICKGWCAAFEKETGLAVSFESLESPREYNFATDRLFVTLSPEALETIKTAHNTSEFATILTDWFTSRSGFISSYSNDPEADKWQAPVETWDHNQLSALLAAWLTVEGYNSEKLESNLLGEHEVYEAAQAVWDASPETIAA